MLADVVDVEVAKQCRRRKSWWGSGDVTILQSPAFFASASSIAVALWFIVSFWGW